MSVFQHSTAERCPNRQSYVNKRSNRAKMLLRAIDALENNSELSLEQKRRGIFPLRRALLRMLDDNRAQ